jgi:uncharacterized membrane protein
VRANNLFGSGLKPRRSVAVDVMTPILHSFDSLVHLVAALLALGSGTTVLLLPKGTPRHRRWGRAYVAAMAVVVATAFRLYFLFGRFGVLHAGAVACAGTLLVGTGAVAGRARVRAWARWHYAGMGASVAGLYAALAAEATYRFFPPRFFWWSTLGPAGAVLLAGGLLLYRYYPRRARSPA